MASPVLDWQAPPATGSQVLPRPILLLLHGRLSASASHRHYIFGGAGAIPTDTTTIGVRAGGEHPVGTGTAASSWLTLITAAVSDKDILSKPNEHERSKWGIRSSIIGGKTGCAATSANFWTVKHSCPIAKRGK